MSYLPIGIQTFRDIRTNDFLYIDKTGIIEDLVRPGKGVYFLNRPRRFGKSLLVSTLASLFRGEREIFEGLAIAESGYAFPSHPVLVFDFSLLSHGDPDALREGISDEIDQMAAEHDVSISRSSLLETRLRSLLRGLATRNQVVILVDEYDKPIIEHLDDPDIAEGCRDVLRSFFGVIKGSDALLRFVFITGITRFSKVTLFSEMNNLRDISGDGRFASLLGLTEKEIDDRLSDKIDQWAARSGRATEELRRLMRERYNGYRFTRDETWVYNPWSILQAIEMNELRNFWFDSGSPRFLMRLLEERLQEPGAFSIGDLQDIPIDADSLPSFDVRHLSLEVILFQAGYLTIKRVSGALDCATLHLGFPNREVEESLLHAVMTYLTLRDEIRSREVVKRLTEALQASTSKPSSRF